MHIMQELPTNKPNFLFKNTKDFNQTIHVGPQEPIVLIDNISFYFYAFISVKKISETVTQWYIMAISIWSENFPSFEVEYTLQNTKCMLFNRVLFNLDCATVSKWQNMVIYEMF